MVGCECFMKPAPGVSPVIGYLQHGTLLYLCYHCSLFFSMGYFLPEIKKSQSQISIDGKMIDDDVQIANSFNTFLRT